MFTILNHKSNFVNLIFSIFTIFPELITICAPSHEVWYLKDGAPELIDMIMMELIGHYILPGVNCRVKDGVAEVNCSRIYSLRS